MRLRFAFYSDYSLFVEIVSKDQVNVLYLSKRGALGESLYVMQIRVRNSRGFAQLLIISA